MKKKILALFLVVALFACFAACGGFDKPSSGDGSNNPSPGSNEPVKESDEFKPLELVDSQTFVEHGYIFAYTKIHNPNNDYAVQFPTIRVTARDAEGVLLGTEDQTMNIVYPGQDLETIWQMCSVEEDPADITVELLDPEDYGITKTAKLDHPEYKDLEIVNPAVKSEKVVCEVSNPNDYDIDGAVVFVIFKNDSGELVGSTYTFTDKINAGGSVPVEFGYVSGETTENFEAFASLWY